MEINNVTVIGANGTMGCSVSGIFASFGNAKVYMVCRNKEIGELAKQKASMSVKAETIERNLFPKTYEELEYCISKSDFVFESVSEKIEIKKDIYKKIKKYVNENTIIASGTSGLSINELSEIFDNKLKKRFIGMHFFNPPYSMILCELIPSKFTDIGLFNDLKLYLEIVLRRKVVKVKDTPAFLGNRIGFQFINQALQYAEKYKNNGGIDYIDAILGTFTGRSMAPLITSDFVGLDIHKAIVDNVYENTDDYFKNAFIMPKYAIQLIGNNQLGRKTEGGLYQVLKNENGVNEIKVYDIKSNSYRYIQKYDFAFSKQMISEMKIGNYEKAFCYLKSSKSKEAKICLAFLINYVIYSIFTAKNIGENIHSADDVMVTGFNWAPPLGMVEVLGGFNELKRIAIEKCSFEFMENININEMLCDYIPKSQYDFRPFFKVKQEK